MAEVMSNLMKQSWIKKFISAYEIAMDAEGVPEATIKAVTHRIIWGGTNPSADKAPWDR